MKAPATAIKTVSKTGRVGYKGTCFLKATGYLTGNCFLNKYLSLEHQQTKPIKVSIGGLYGLTPSSAQALSM